MVKIDHLKQASPGFTIELHCYYGHVVLAQAWESGSEMGSGCCGATRLSFVVPLLKKIGTALPARLQLVYRHVGPRAGLPIVSGIIFGGEQMRAM